MTDGELQNMIDTMLKLGSDRSRFLSALQHIARYQTKDEMPEEQASKADFVSGYANMIDYARAVINGSEGADE